MKKGTGTLFQSKRSNVDVTVILVMKGEENADGPENQLRRSNPPKSPKLGKNSTSWVKIPNGINPRNPHQDTSSQTSKLKTKENIKSSRREMIH